MICDLISIQIAHRKRGGQVVEQGVSLPTYFRTPDPRPAVVRRKSLVFMPTMGETEGEDKGPDGARGRGEQTKLNDARSCLPRPDIDYSFHRSARTPQACRTWKSPDAKNPSSFAEGDVRFPPNHTLFQGRHHLPNGLGRMAVEKFRASGCGSDDNMNASSLTKTAPHDSRTTILPAAMMCSYGNDFGQLCKVRIVLQRHDEKVQQSIATIGVIHSCLQTRGSKGAKARDAPKGYHGNEHAEKILEERKFALPRYFEYKWPGLEVWR
ncbi:hypothetical protein CPLU01_14586 [Colletotrichum plurivorum]|uniref:Uncharacterized protein n=1 Tax=Colletotrichum plurivorum TaxID=2175906 RepID=A0A8H6JI98_9PEZI|nr:hypothetical protein CPLU01_14586 [Colletotrichum plurivorum]